MKFSHFAGALSVVFFAVTACSESAIAVEDRPAAESRDVKTSVTTANSEEPQEAPREDSVQLAADLAIINKACRATPNTNNSVCQCVEGKARALKSAELALAVSQYEGNEARAAEAREKLDILGLTRGGSFLVNAPIECSG